MALFFFFLYQFATTLTYKANGKCSSCCHRVLNLCPSDPGRLRFAAVPSLQYLAIFMAPHSRAPFRWPVLWGTTLQQSPASCPDHSQDFLRTHLLGSQKKPALVFVSSTWSSQVVSHPSTILAQCCLTSVWKWELVFPTWHGPLTAS